MEGRGKRERDIERKREKNIDVRERHINWLPPALVPARAGNRTCNRVMWGPMRKTGQGDSFLKVYYKTDR